MMPDVRSHWPIRLTTFVGREQERADIAQLLAARRLVTLTGTGGVGKTRLALEIGGDVRAAYRDGGFLAELASVVDAGTVPQRIAEALGISETAGESLQDLPFDLVDPLVERPRAQLVQAEGRFAEGIG